MITIREVTASGRPFRLPCLFTTWQEGFPITVICRKIVHEPDLKAYHVP